MVNRVRIRVRVRIAVRIGTTVLGDHQIRFMVRVVLSFSYFCTFAFYTGTSQHTKQTKKLYKVRESTC